MRKEKKELFLGAKYKSDGLIYCTCTSSNFEGLKLRMDFVWQTCVVYSHGVFESLILTFTKGGLLCSICCNADIKL